MKLYFAYGSNMSDSQMNDRCPDNKKMGVAILPGYRWIISTRGLANVVKAQESEVEGILWEISPTDENNLDKFEGVAGGSYGRFEVAVKHDGEVKSALIYIDPCTEEGRSKDEYVKRMNRALADAKLSESYVIQIRKFIPE